MKQEYWSYDPDDGLQLHDTLEKAKCAAEDWLWDACDPEDGWKEGVESVSYGRLEVCGKAVINSRRPVNAEEDGEWAATHFTEMVDYQMQDVAQPVDVADIIAERDAAVARVSVLRAELNHERQQHASTREMLRALERGEHMSSSRVNPLCLVIRALLERMLKGEK